MLSEKQAIDMLRSMKPSANERAADLKCKGYPAYTTATGWINYSDEKMICLCQSYLEKGYTAFKIKIGQDFERDFARCQLMRKEIGYTNTLMFDSNQVFDVNEAIEWVSKLKEFKPLWIEEPTSPDDILGHAKIAEALKYFI